MSTPLGRPAGIVATTGCEVMTEGWVVTPGGSAACEVTTEGWPVTTPRELVWVR